MKKINILLESGKLSVGYHVNPSNYLKGVSLLK
jgi:hypothetical protein